jgi:hypothetical protein
MKSATHRADHFKKDVIRSTVYPETNVNTYRTIEDGEVKPNEIKIGTHMIVKCTPQCNHNVCIDWIMKGCKDSNCKNDHYIPSNYKYKTCENWKNGRCTYSGKYCKDIHGNDDLIVWYIKRNTKLFIMDGDTYKIKDDTSRRSRSRSRSRDSNYDIHERRYKY